MLNYIAMVVSIQNLMAYNVSKLDLITSFVITEVSLTRVGVCCQEREVQIARSRGTPVRASPSPVSVSRQDSMAGSLHEHFTPITQVRDAPPGD